MNVSWQRSMEGETSRVRARSMACGRAYTPDMTPSPGAELPALDEMGRDLLEVPAWRRALSLGAPFALAVAFFAFAQRGLWLPALACRSEEHTSELQSLTHLVCRLLL